MSQITQISRKKRKMKITKNQRGLKLYKNPQKKVICIKIQTMSPKKPNSANRRVAKVRFLQKGNFTTIKIPGEKHNLQQHSTLLVCGGRSRDLIGVHLKAIRGKYDLAGVSGRKRARSLYGVKKM
jgi:small subunit ribosomal protein S12